MTNLPEAIFRQVSDDLMVRRASPDDLPALLELLAQMNDEPTVDRAQMSEDTFREISASPSRALLVAVLDEALVGTVDLFVMANLTHGERPWAGIENFIVDSDHRRQGIGRALMNAAIDLARQANCYKLQLVSHEQRSAAHDLYRRTGFDIPVHGYRRHL